MLEYPVDALPEEYSFRLKRFSTAYYLTNPRPINYLPYTMVDSGYMIHTDYDGTYNATKAAYRAMVEPELSRLPKALITAYWERVGNHFNFLVEVTNQSGVTLSKDSYDAEISALVYEDVTPDPTPVPPDETTNYHTNRYVRALTHQPLTTPLKDGGSTRFTLSTKDIRPLDWNKLHGLVFIDYRPGGSAGKYDMLQAAPAVITAVAKDIAVDRPSLLFLEDRSKPSNPTQTFKVSGFPSTITWMAVSTRNWLKISPTSGGLGNQVTVSLDIKNMIGGTYDGEIQVSAVMPDPKIQRVIPVRLVLMDSLNYFWLPVIGGPVPTRLP